jgi:hypothetical protein
VVRVTMPAVDFAAILAHERKKAAAARRAAATSAASAVTLASGAHDPGHPASSSVNSAGGAGEATSAAFSVGDGLLGRSLASAGVAGESDGVDGQAPTVTSSTTVATRSDVWCGRTLQKLVDLGGPLPRVRSVARFTHVHAYSCTPSTKMLLFHFSTPHHRLHTTRHTHSLAHSPTQRALCSLRRTTDGAKIFLTRASSAC